MPIVYLPDRFTEVDGANVVCKKNGETIGTLTTGPDGKVTFESLEAGNYSIEASFVGVHETFYGDITIPVPDEAADDVILFTEECWGVFFVVTGVEGMTEDPETRPWVIIAAYIEGGSPGASLDQQRLSIDGYVYFHDSSILDSQNLIPMPANLRLAVVVSFEGQEPLYMGDGIVPVKHQAITEVIDLTD